MKKVWITILTALMLTVLVTGCAEMQASPASDQPRALNVTGTGTVYVQPDIAQINVGVQTQSANAVDALAENTANANAIQQVLIEKGVAENDIQTNNFSIYRTTQYATEDGEAEQTFVVENTVIITVRDLSSLGEILSAVVEQGANTIYGVVFDVEDPESAITEARELAIQDARAQAEAIATAAGVDLGEIYSLTVNESGSTPLTLNEAATASGGGGSVPVSTGTLSVEVNVYITYEFE